MEAIASISPDTLNSYSKLCKTIPLYPLHDQQDYDKAVLVLNCLLDMGGADENHPLARLVEALGLFIGDYEIQHAIEF